jgi:hypothetical protein
MRETLNSVNRAKLPKLSDDWILKCVDWKKWKKSGDGELLRHLIIHSMATPSLPQLQQHQGELLVQECMAS